MDKLKQMDQILNNLFQITFDETKIYVFSEQDKDGFTYINITDQQVYELIKSKRSKFAALISDYVNVNNVKINLVKKEINPIKTKNEFPLLKEVIVNEVIKKKIITEKVFIIRNKHSVDNEFLNEVVSRLKELKSFIHDYCQIAFKEHEKGLSEGNKVKEDNLLYGKMLALSETFQYVKGTLDYIESARIKTVNPTEIRMEIINKIEDFIDERYEKIKVEQKKIRENDEDYLNNIAYSANYGEVAFMASLNSLLMKYKDELNK